VIILVSGSAKLIRHFGPVNLGGLVTPQSGTTGDAYNCLRASWAMDNDCFLALKRAALTKMWLANQPFAKNCLWATVPDVVGNAGATLRRWEEWSPIVRSFGYKLAYVAQDGIEGTTTPWGDFNCLFLGGTTGFKVGPVAKRFVQEAKHRGKKIHMGRVNGPVRLRLALDWGCDSVDGTGFSHAGMKHLPWALKIIQEYQEGIEISA
jgi:hypothetical protein